MSRFQPIHRPDPFELEQVIRLHVGPIAQHQRNRNNSSRLPSVVLLLQERKAKRRSCLYTPDRSPRIEPHHAFIIWSFRVDPDPSSINTRPESPPTSRVESGWNRLKPGNRSLFRSNALLIRDSNNSTPFSFIRSFLVGRNTNHSFGILVCWLRRLVRRDNNQPDPFSLDCHPRNEHQQSTGAFYALLLRSDGTTSTHSDCGTSGCSGGNEEQRLLQIAVCCEILIGRTNILFLICYAPSLRLKSTATTRPAFQPTHHPDPFEPHLAFFL